MEILQTEKTTCPHILNQIARLPTPPQAKEIQKYQIDRIDTSSDTLAVGPRGPRSSCPWSFKARCAGLRMEPRCSKTVRFARTELDALPGPISLFSMFFFSIFFSRAEGSLFFFQELKGRVFPLLYICLFVPCVFVLFHFCVSRVSLDRWNQVYHGKRCDRGIVGRFWGTARDGFNCQDTPGIPRDPHMGRTWLGIETKNRQSDCCDLWRSAMDNSRVGTRHIPLPLKDSEHFLQTGCFPPDRGSV